MSQFDDLYEIEEKPKRKRDEDPTTWGDVWKAFGIFAALTLSLTVLIYFLQQVLMGEKYDAYKGIILNTSSAQQEIDMSFMGTYMDSFSNPLFVIMYVAFSLLLMILALFMIYGLVHVFASKVLKGEGTLRGLIVRSNWWTTGTYLVYGAFSGIWSLYLINAVVNRYEGINLSGSAELANEFSQFVLSQNAVLYGVSFVLWVVWSIAISFVTSENYHMNRSKGCTTLILTNVTLIALFCGCTFAIGFGLAGVMMSAT